MTKSSRYRETVLPAGLLASSIIGAGIFALPFVFSEAGLLVGIGYLVIFTAVFTTIHKMYAEIIKNTPGKHRFVGYAEIYLGRKGFWAGTVVTVIGFILILTVYIILAGGFLELVIPLFAMGGAPYLFWALGSLAIILSLKRLASFEFLVTLAIGLIILVLFGAGVLRGGGLDIPVVNVQNLFLPYGVILFALSGRAAISTLWDYYKRNKLPIKKLSGAIAFGTAAPAALYILFVVGVLLLSGGSVSQDSLSGLTGVHPYILILSGTLGVLALWTSYFFLGLEVRDIARYDLHVGSKIAIAGVVFAPIILYMLGLNNFIELVGISGGIFGAAEIAMVVFMYSKMKSWNLLRVSLAFVFITGAIYEITQFF